MTSTRPYLLRAIYEWILDNECTPHLLVDAAADGVQVPQEYAIEGRIVLNVGPAAVRELQMDNDSVRFNARFAGRPRDVFVPIGAVQAIYARENGKGVVFAEEEEVPGEGASSSPQEDSASGGPRLRVVK